MAQGSHSAGADETIRFLFEDDVTARPRNGHRRSGAEALKRNPQTRVIAADFTLEMMRVGRKPNDPPYSAADTFNLPFKNSTFEAVISGFLMRNVTDVKSLVAGTVSRPQVRRANRYP